MSYHVGQIYECFNSGGYRFILGERYVITKVKGTNVHMRGKYAMVFERNRISVENLHTQAENLPSRVRLVDSAVEEAQL